MKALLFQLVRSLEFELDARVEDIGRKSLCVSILVLAAAVASC
jgi:hypothetical protein